MRNEDADFSIMLVLNVFRIGHSRDQDDLSWSHPQGVSHNAHDARQIRGSHSDHRLRTPTGKGGVL